MGLMRSSLKACVWLGGSDCYRNQDDVLWTESDKNIVQRVAAKAGKMPVGRINRPSGNSIDWLKITAKAEERGGVSPFNVLPICNASSTDSAGSHGHGAGTPFDLCDWWVRYISRSMAWSAIRSWGAGQSASRRWPEVGRSSESSETPDISKSPRNVWRSMRTDTRCSLRPCPPFASLTILGPFSTHWSPPKQQSRPAATHDPAAHGHPRSSPDAGEVRASVGSSPAPGDWLRNTNKDTPCPIPSLI